jgi:hypothetical protein
VALRRRYMQYPEYRVPRIHLPHTPVNKGQKTRKASIARRKTKTASLTATPTSSLCAYVSPRRGG